MTRRHALKKLCAFALLVSASAIGKPAPAQLPGAAILGTVKDPTGAAAASAAVTARHVETGLTRATTSAEDGSYRFSALPVGAYEVRVEMFGFRSEVRSGLTLTISEEAVVNFALQPGVLDQTVVVTVEAPLVNTTSGSLGGLVDESRVREMPLNGRNFVDLSLLQTGITPHRNLAVAATTVGLWFSSNGAPLRSNNYLLDGAIITNLTNGNPASQDGSTLGLEGIREFRVITNSPSAEYGMTMGSQVIAVSKGGTNALHGSLFEYFRNSALDARNFFDYKTAAENRRLPALARNQFGGSIGGPIRKDKAFFFGLYEGLQQRLGVTTNRFTIPAACHVVTDNPCITAPANDNPDRNVAPVIQPLLELYPLPNLPDNRFTFPFAQRIKVHHTQGRVDRIFSSADRMFARYTFNHATQTDPLNFPQFRTFRFSRSSFATLSEEHSFSPSLLGVFRASFSATHLSNSSPSGIIGPQYSFVPGMEIGSTAIGGVTTLGPHAAPTTLKQNILTWSGDLFHTRGRHSLKFGTLVNGYRQYMLTSVNAAGTIAFANINAFLQGLASQYSAQTPGSARDRTYRFNTFGFYVHEDWRVLANLTLNAGLRYEFMTSPREVHGREAALRDIERDAATTLGAAFENMSLLNFSPRIGFAWDVTGEGKTAVRGGFAQLYDVGVFAVSLAVASQATPPFSSFSSVGAPSTLTLPLVFPEPGKTLRLVDYRLGQPRMLNYNLTVEQELPWRLGLTLSYAGSRGFHLMRTREGNPTIPEILPDGRKFWPANAPRINPNWGSIDLHTAEGDSWYNALQLGLNKRLSSGLQFQSSYTWSKLIDETQGQARADNQPSSTYGSDPSNPRADRAPADFDLRHNWQFNTIYHLPRAFRHQALHAALDGWRASSILSVHSGYPFTPSVRTNRSRSGVNAGQPGAASINVDRPNLAPGRGRSNIILGRPDRYFDPTAFTLPDPGYLGTSGRNILTGPGYFNLDLALAKIVPMSTLIENGTLEFRGEFFNLLNHPNFAMTDTFREVFVGSAADESPLPTAGVLTTTGSARSRQIQFAVRLLFR